MKLNDCTSEGKCIKYDIQQGSALDPILFILYINVLYGLKTDGDLHWRLVPFFLISRGMESV